MGAIWEPFERHSGSHFGAIWGLEAEGASGRHLGSFWATTPQRNAKVPFNLQFYEAFLRVRSQSTVNYNISWWAAAANGSALQPRPLSNAVRTPQINLFGEYIYIYIYGRTGIRVPGVLVRQHHLTRDATGFSNGPY